MGRAADAIVVTGVGLAVPGLERPADLLGGARTAGGFDPVRDLVGRDLRHKDRGSRLALRAVQPALADAGLLDVAAPPQAAGFIGAADRTAVVVSSNLGILENVCECVDVIADETVTALPAMGLPQTSINVIAGSVAIRFGLRGPNVTVANGPTGGLDALHWAGNLIRAGRAEAAVVVGVEPTGEAVAKLLGGDSADAAVAVVLESAAGAAARGAAARAVVAHYRRAPDLDGAVAGALGVAGAPVELWLPPERTQPTGIGADVVAAAPDGARTVRLDWLGRCSGALGVLQCAFAAVHFAAGGRGPALAAAHDPDALAAVALLLTEPDS